MKFYTRTMKIKSHYSNQMINITHQVKEVVDQCEINNGIITVFVPHTTAAVTINENADPDVKTDLLEGLSVISPIRDTHKHVEGNSHAHIKSSLIGTSEQIILESNQLLLGTWQGIYFCEFDGPRHRKFTINIIGE